jgi:hypothetical protein
VTTDPIDPAAEPTEPAAEPAAEPEVSLTTKIAIIEGERFSVPYDMPVDQIRENLAGTYPGVRTARVDQRTIDIQGVRYETIEFSKQGGTKGLVAEGAGTPLLALLALPRLPIGPLPNAAHVHLLRRGAYTFAEALELPLFEGGARTRSSSSLRGGYALCQRLDHAPAVAAGPDLIVPGWSA